MLNQLFCVSVFPLREWESLTATRTGRTVIFFFQIGSYRGLPDTISNWFLESVWSWPFQARNRVQTWSIFLLKWEAEGWVGWRLQVCLEIGWDLKNLRGFGSEGPGDLGWGGLVCLFCFGILRTAVITKVGEGVLIAGERVNAAFAARVVHSLHLHLLKQTDNAGV